jgi:hypothetical protein
MREERQLFADVAVNVADDDGHAFFHSLEITGQLSLLPAS